MDVAKVAQLARLNLTAEEQAKFQAQLKNILISFEEISKINTEGVEPLVTPVDVELVYRKDEDRVTLSVEEALQNAPERAGNLFRVPPVV